MTIYAISDLHTDNRENRELVEQISTTEFLNDTLLIAGDISNKLEVIESTLNTLQARFKKLFFVPGNHELWVTKDDDHSIAKFERILALCSRLGIATSPQLVEDVWIVPLFSWYESDFFPAGNINDPQLEGWSDFHFCQWPDQIDPLSYFLALNRPNIRGYDRPVISFSHFVPRLELIPPPEVLFFKSLPLVSGSNQIEAQLREINSHVHLFGHTHINRDQTIDNVRYVQNALRYPRERKMFGRSNRLKLTQVWPTSN